MFLDRHGNRVSDERSRRAGFDIAVLTAGRRKREHIARAIAVVDAEMRERMAAGKGTQSEEEAAN